MGINFKKCNNIQKYIYIISFIKLNILFFFFTHKSFYFFLTIKYVNNTSIEPLKYTWP